MASITQIGRVMVPVESQDAAIAFYTGTLGFNVVADVPFGDGDRWLEAASPLTSAVGSKDVEELRIDAGHVGLFIGRSSRKVTLPKVIDWMRRHSDEL